MIKFKSDLSRKSEVGKKKLNNTISKHDKKKY